MIRSMTGFAAVARDGAAGTVNVTIKSVNHRFLDVVVKAPQSLGALEARAKALVQQKLTRGRVEITLGADVRELPDREVVLDEALLDRVAAALEVARARGVITGGLTASDLLRIPQVLDIRTKSIDTAGAGSTPVVAELVDVAMTAAIETLAGMRETEGRLLAADLEQRLATIQGFVETLESAAREAQQTLETRLRERVAQLPPDLRGEASAVSQEIVRFVARSDIDEEVVRMRSHLEHWRALAAGPEPCGRKLDFLVQEMNREINTMGSKAEGTRAIETVIAAKAELERIREQVQNVE